MASNSAMRAKKKSPSPFSAHDDPVTGNAVITLQGDAQDSIHAGGCAFVGAASERLSACMKLPDRLSHARTSTSHDVRFRAALGGKRKSVKPIYEYTP